MGAVLDGLGECLERWAACGFQVPFFRDGIRWMAGGVGLPRAMPTPFGSPVGGDGSAAPAWDGSEPCLGRGGDESQSGGV